MSQNGNRLLELREQRGWNRARIAVEFDVVERTVARWETGESAIPSDFIPRLADLLEVSTDHLMGWDREPVSGQVTS